MRNKFIVIVLLITIVVMQGAAVVYANDEVQSIFKFGTDNAITIHGKEVKVPKVFDNTKEQFRGIWISTVSNIDFPSKETVKDGVITKEEYIADYNKILDRSLELNLNALIFQVSPMLDSWYKSNINPWSQYLTGKQGGVPNFENWDCMKWMIEETHKKGLEFHAWFNPYRVTNNPKDDRSKDQKLAELAEGNFAKENPQVVYEFENKLYLDPGRTEVIDHIVDTVEEVVVNYDVDGVHFDDYFYPYQYKSKLKNNDPPDKNTFEKFKNGINDINEWRRNNVNKMIQSVSESISKFNKDKEKSIEFGVSPFGIWGHFDETNGVGSHTPKSSTSSYEDYVDSIKWAKEKWVDYLIPQIYWSFSNKSAPYGELVDWWANEFSKIEESHLYIGHANYKYLNNSNDNDWKNPEEISNQLKFNQKYDYVKGSCMFSFNSLNDNQATQGEEHDINSKFIQELKNEYFTMPVNTPSKPWLDNNETKPVKGLEIEEKDNSIELTWKDNNKDTRFYAIYRQRGSEFTPDGINAQNMIGRIGKEAGGTFSDNNLNSDDDYTYAVTVIDEAGNETEPMFVSKSVDNFKLSLNLVDNSKIALILGIILILLCSLGGIILASFL